MARGTRGSAARSAAAIQDADADAGSKRKRRGSNELGDASAGDAAAGNAAEANGDHETKRQKLALLANGSSEQPAEGLDAHEAEGQARVLTKQVREAIAVVIAQMAAGLPKPINMVLRLGLPPNFDQTDENTLGYLLKKSDLTWEKLVATLHLFCEHLLLPASYPNPVPSLARIHLPVPPLPSHFPPLVVYTFCAALTKLLLQVEPPSDDSKAPVTPDIERWALMQKTPGNGLGSAGGEWFTSSVNLRQVDLLRQKIGTQQTLMETLSAEGNKFGHAQAIQVQAAAPLGQPDAANIPTLSESVIRRASLKAQRWKDELAARRKGTFVSSIHPVVVPHVTNAAWTPSFAPTYDSTSASGLGYQSTLDVLHEGARQRNWVEASASIAEVDGHAPWQGVIEKKAEEGAAEEKTASEEKDPDTLAPAATLSANAERIEELQGWQELRVRRGDPDWITERESLVAQELLDSLAHLVESADIKPSALLPKNAEPGSLALAHKLARRLLSNRVPIIRGTLDPRRQQALHDNVTIRLRAQAAAAIGTPGANGVSPHVPPPKASPGTPYPPSQSMQIREPPPHTLPSSNQRYAYPQQRGYQAAPHMPMQAPAQAPSPVQQPVQMRQPMPAPMGMHPSAYGSPMGQFRPPNTALAHNVQMHPNYRSPHTPGGPGSVPVGSPSPSPGSPAPMGAAYPQRMVGLPPSQLRQSYAPMPMGMPSPQGHLPPGTVYGSPVQFRQQPLPGAPGMPMPGVPGMPGMMPGQMQMHR